MVLQKWVNDFLWCLRGNGGMDPYRSPYITPSSNPYNPFPNSLLSTREFLAFLGFGLRVGVPLSHAGEGKASELSQRSSAPLV